MFCIRIVDFRGLAHLPDDRGRIILQGSLGRLRLRASAISPSRERPMPGKGSLIGFADQSKRQCRERLRQNIAIAVEELLDDGWEPECIAEALLELADSLSHWTC